MPGLFRSSTPHVLDNPCTLNRFHSITAAYHLVLHLTYEECANKGINIINGKIANPSPPPGWTSKHDGDPFRDPKASMPPDAPFAVTGPLRTSVSTEAAMECDDAGSAAKSPHPSRTMPKAPEVAPLFPHRPYAVDKHVRVCASNADEGAVHMHDDESLKAQWETLQLLTFGQSANQQEHSREWWVERSC